jgi:type IV secretion system protein TrbF
MKLFGRSKKQVDLSPAPGMYAEDDPQKIIFDNKTRLQVEKNHWKLFCAALIVITGLSIATRQPPPSVVRAYGVSADAKGDPVIRRLTSYDPDAQALRHSLAETTEHWFTIEPLLVSDIKKSRMAANIHAVKGQMEGQSMGQFDKWFADDAPYQAVLSNPKLLRQVHVNSVALLEDSTAVISFTTSTTRSDSDPANVETWTLTIRYQVVPPTADDALTANPFGTFFPYYTLQKTA